MANARRNSEWQQTATLEALHLNLNRSKGGKIISPEELNPFGDKHQQSQTKITGKVAWDIVKTMYTANNKKK